jgi:C-terminal processing protease CtpA/Prc
MALAAALLAKIVHELDANYVSAEVARRVTATLRERAAHGAYDKITDGNVFADTLTREMQRVSHDRHLRVVHRPPRGPQLPEPDVRAMNYGFGAIERLKGGVARVVIHGFLDIDGVRDGVSNLMSQVADADALVLDLRDNTGGDAHTVDLVASYLFDDKPVRLRDMIERDGSVTSAWTDPLIKGKRFGGKKPIYVLTSAHTISGGESLAFSLQHLHRATVIGEKTAGAANLSHPCPLDAWFALILPVVRVIDPVTKTSWEGVGVRPDVAVPADTALDEALRRVEHDRRRGSAVDDHSR